MARQPAHGAPDAPQTAIRNPGTSPAGQWTTNDGIAENLEIEEIFTTEYNSYRKYSPDRKVTVAYDEWMPGGALKHRGGLSAAMMFNSLERCWDKVTMAAPAPLFWHQRLGTSWSGTLIHHDHIGWFPTPIYLANKPDAVNTMAKPDEIKVAESTAKLKGKTLEYTFLKHSAVLIEFRASQ